MANNCGNVNSAGGKRPHTHAMKSAMGEASNNSNVETSIAVSGSSSSHHTSSNHCEDWNPNQIVYNKVRYL